MLEVKLPGVARTGYNGHTTAVNKGVFMRNTGVAFVAGDVPPGTTGNASVGDAPKMVLATQYIHSGYGVFPVGKLIFATEGAEQSLDTIASGARLFYLEGGEIETDEYDVTCSGTGTANGDKIWLNSSGQIALSGSNGADPAGWNLPPIGEIVKVSSFPQTANWYNGGVTGTKKKTVWYRLYPWHAHAVGNQFVSL